MNYFIDYERIANFGIFTRAISCVYYTSNTQTQTSSNYKSYYYCIRLILFDDFRVRVRWFKVEMCKFYSNIITY